MPDQYFGPCLSVLLRLCHATTSQMLPPLYHQLANSKKKQERGVIQQHVDDSSDELNIHHRVIVTPNIAKKVAVL